MSKSPEGHGIELPIPQLQDAYKRWRGLEPTGVEEVDRAREYYIGLLRKELQKRGALHYIPPSDNPGTGEDYLPMPPGQGPPLPRSLGIQWPWRR